MITRAYIQQYDRAQKEPEHKDVFAVLSARNVDCTWVTLRKILPGVFDFNRETFFAGDHDLMQAVFRKAGIHYPERDSYPESLRGFLKREVWESTVMEMQLKVNTADFEPCFIKPQTDTKLFTGFVLSSAKNLYKLEGLPRNTKLHCAALVSWKSEFRVFVNQAQMVGVRHYAGDKTCQIDLKVVEEAIAALEKSVEKTAAYALDFGVLENGDTALVEWNDGFALGSYNLDPEIYTDLLISRWEELMM